MGMAGVPGGVATVALYENGEKVGEAPVMEPMSLMVSPTRPGDLPIT